MTLPSFDRQLEYLYNENDGGVQPWEAEIDIARNLKNKSYCEYCPEIKKASEVAREIGVHHTSIRDWINSYQEYGSQKAFPGSGHSRDADDEVKKLRRELANLKEENEILKKAAAYFAKNQR